jgi:hypothetical protein
MTSPNEVEENPKNSPTTSTTTTSVTPTLTTKTTVLRTPSYTESEESCDDDVKKATQHSISPSTQNGSNLSAPKTSLMNQDSWPKLSIDMIATSFKVVTDLPDGAKLKIVDDTHLAEDNSYVKSLSRYTTGQNRNKVISFLDHLFHETDRNIAIILGEIRSGVNVDTNISVLYKTIGKIYTFLHRYENMRNVYKKDSSAFARLGNIRDKFYTYLDTFFRNVLVVKN